MSQGVLRWLAGAGWLVLAGSADVKVRGQALGRSMADGSLVCVTLGERGEHLLNEWQELGARSGYWVDALAEDDETLRTALAEASLIVLGDFASAQEWRSALLGAGQLGMRTAFEHGALVIAEGAAAMALGAWFIEDGRLVTDGLGWVSAAMIVPQAASLAEASSDIQDYMSQQTATVALCIAAGAGLAFGAGEHIQILGNQRVSVAFGALHRG